MVKDYFTDCKLQTNIINCKYFAINMDIIFEIGENSIY